MYNNKSYAGLFSIGNSKLHKSVLIFNLNSAHDCPSRKLGLCMVAGICYAYNAERQYKACLAYRRRQEKYWNKTKAFEFVWAVDNIKKKRPYITALRINEAGDFRTQNDVYKLNYISECLKEIGITTYCYTSRNDLDFSRARFVVRGSGWEARQGRTTVVYPGQEIPKGFKVCPGEKCGEKCKLCQSQEKINIAFHKH